MWLKNLVVYRLPAKFSLEAAVLEKALALQPLQPCGSFDMESRGWLPPQAEGAYLHTQGKQWMLALGVEQKLLPATVIRQRTQEKALGRLSDEIAPLVRTSYQAKGCSILLNREALTLNLANPAMDITAPVVTALNAKITQFTFDRERLDQAASNQAAGRPAAPAAAPAPRR